MKEKEYQKKIADARRGVSRKYGLRQSSYINFKVEKGYFFCVFFLTDEVRLTVKPMYADDLWWDIWDALENKKEPLSLRGTGAFSLSGQVLMSTTFKVNKESDTSDLTDIMEHVFQEISVNIEKFLKDNPNADVFFPDESKMDHDPDRLLYLMALIHNGKEHDALTIIADARRQKHECMFKSGMFSDSYTYIRRWCNRRQTGERIRRVFNSILNKIIKVRAYALTAFTINNNVPGIYDRRAFDGAFLLAAITFLLYFFDNFTLAWIIIAIYAIFVFFIDFNKMYDRYNAQFLKLPHKTKLIWKVGAWVVVVSLYVCIFVKIYISTHK